MPYNFVADSIHTKKLCSRLSSSKVQFYMEKRPFCVFEPPFGGLGTTYDVCLRLTGKCDQIPTENRSFRSNRFSLTENFKYKGSPQPTILFLRKLG